MKMGIYISIFLIVILAFIGTIEKNKSIAQFSDKVDSSNEYGKEKIMNDENLKEIYLAGGCFWGLEAYMEKLYGVYDVTSGYANGDTENPKYEDLIYKNSGHAETVHIKYDPEKTDIETLLYYYFKVINPTSLNKQGNDRGTQYRTGIYYTDENEKMIIEEFIKEEQKKYSKDIVVEVMALDHYYLAEEYHQDYLNKNPNGYCHIDLSEADEIYIDPAKYLKPTDEFLKKNLTDIQYRVTQLNDTEGSFSNEYWNLFDDGIISSRS